MENQQINFFWESKEIGFVLLVLSIGTHLSINNTFKTYGASTETRNIWIGFFQVIFSAIFLGQLIIANFSSSLIAAKESVYNSRSIQQELGNIVGFGILINGFPAILSEREANISLLIKGERKFERIIVELESNDGNWQLKKLRKDR